MTTNGTKVALCEGIIRYDFTKKILCLEALQTSGNALWWQNEFVQVKANDKLAVLGDTATKAHLCKKWYETGRSKGQWTEVEQAILSRSNLGTVGYVMGLAACVVLNPGTTSASPKTMATTVEAVLGAVYLDGGSEVLGRVITVLGLDHKLLEMNRNEESFEGFGEDIFLGF